MSVSCCFQSDLSASCWKLLQTLKYLSHVKYRPQNQNTSPEPEHSAHLPRPAPTEGPPSLLRGTAECVWERVCSCINTYAVAYVYIGVCTLSSSAIIQHVSRVLTGGSVRSSSGGVQADDDDVIGRVFTVACFINEEVGQRPLLAAMF